MSTSLPKFNQARLLVVGDVMLDRYWHGSTSRISPEAPVPVVHVSKNEQRPGGAGNVALNITALGANCSLIGAVGNDDAGVYLNQQLTSAKVKTYLQTVTGSPTVTKLRVLSRHQQLIRLDFEETQLAINEELLLTDYQEQLKQTNCVILSDYGKGTLPACQKLIGMAREQNIPVLVDPKQADYEHYRGASLITPNLNEFFAAAQTVCTDEATLRNKGYELIERYDLGGLLITRSSQGMTLLQKGRTALHIPVIEQEVFDVTGAGDTVIATVAGALAAGESIENAVKLANLAASIAVSKLGTASVSVAELMSSLLSNEPMETGCVNEERLISIVQAAKLRGEKIVMTNGCFDLLHVGHINYLQQAKQLGDRLIIAVNDDDSVKRLKGSGRPINALEHRMTVLAHLGMVDWVVPFSEDTPQRLIERVKPHVLVKGGDYKVNEIAGSDSVLKAGGEVKILDFIPGHSTTKTIKQIGELL